MTPAVLVTAAVLLAGTGVAGWWVCRERARCHAEVAQLRQELDHARYAANHDALTGLPNRRAFSAAGEALLAGAADRTLVGLVVDVDEFKVINDTFGHVAGDEVLVAVAARLLRCAAGGLVGRLGGDEFVGLLVAPAGDPTWPADLARRLRLTLREPVWLAGRPVRVTASIGLAPVRAPVPLGEVLCAADRDMYREKWARRAQLAECARSTRSMSPGVTASATTARPPLMASATRSAEST